MIHISFDKRERSSENYSSRHGANFAYLIRISFVTYMHDLQDTRIFHHFI